MNSKFYEYLAKSEQDIEFLKKQLTYENPFKLYWHSINETRLITLDLTKPDEPTPRIDKIHKEKQKLVKAFLKLAEEYNKELKQQLKKELCKGKCK